MTDFYGLPRKGAIWSRLEKDLAELGKGFHVKVFIRPE